METWDTEKPWYSSVLIAFIRDDVPHTLGISPSVFARDILTLRARLAEEGESFLTKTLPALGKSFDLALQRRQPLITRAFSKQRGDARPKFLSALLRLIFDRFGELRATPCPVAIRLFRQICYWFKKVEKGYDEKSLQKATRELIEVDSCLPTEETLPRDGFLDFARDVITCIFRDFPGQDKWHPKHGPGSVACGASPIEKRRRLGTHAYSQLESQFPACEWFFFEDHSSLQSIRKEMNRLSCEYGLSRTEFVEKDSGGPRVIGLEPMEYMWCQQALKGALYDYLETNPWTSGYVNFTNQNINRELTKQWEKFDTLDMSKASDRVSLALVKYLFSGTKILDQMLACRTPGTVLPSGDILWYRKFAPMGSAVCFPIEACVFYALALVSLFYQGVPFSLARRLTYVYGDDIIVPHGTFEQLSVDFSRYGLKFNADKSCFSGKFRESCGADTFDGQDVTPLRLKKAYPKRGTPDIIPLVEHCNKLFLQGYWSSSEELRRKIFVTYPEFRVIRSKIPYTTRSDLPILAWVNFHRDTVRYTTKNGITYIRGLTFRPSSLRDKEKEDEAIYYREFLARGGPVGILPNSAGERALSKRYDGKLSFRKLVVTPP